MVAWWYGGKRGTFVRSVLIKGEVSVIYEFEHEISTDWKNPLRDKIHVPGSCHF
jgi:hypothetical protein